ncbi:hypothetical protein RT723_08410 [Psychrosphaera aquimarina]|jgi:hypothetical protein|uniref:Uncharacterized protein n=1 Tax=Psychrosphaera aquimarina TaxID=2044854 RepID=A0ABU3R018_9GAMM|nr:hypothetical protein [Psychrosphaera aquimarina]MDU0113017.1 hypothetical protein [Psychrosphaera aquimarina]
MSEIKRGNVDNNSNELNWQGKTKQNINRVKMWTLAWVISMALANFGPKFLWNQLESLTIAAITLNFLLGVGMIYANKIYIQNMDEMQKEIHLNSMAWTLGVGLIVGLSYSNLDVTNVISGPAQISHLILVMGVTNLIAIFVGSRRYK